MLLQNSNQQLQLPILSILPVHTIVTKQLNLSSIKHDTTKKFLQKNRISTLSNHIKRHYSSPPPHLPVICLGRVGELISQQIDHGRNLIMISSHRQLFYNSFNLYITHQSIKIHHQQQKKNKNWTVEDKTSPQEQRFSASRTTYQRDFGERKQKWWRERRP